MSMPVIEGPDAGTEPDATLLRARLGKPIERATAITQSTLQLFPVRVWRHFLRHNGFLLSAGMSYQGLFALAALIYLSFAAAGTLLGASPAAIRWLIRVVNGYFPGLIADHGGLVTPDQVFEIAGDSTGTFGFTGAIAAVALIWTAIGAVTITRRAVRDIFGLPFDTRSYVILKLRDLLAALVFGLALLIGAALSVAGVWALSGFFELLGWSTLTLWYDIGVRLSSVIVVFVIDAGALALLVRFLTGTSLPWRIIWPGALLGGGAVTVLQLGAGLLLSRSPGNALLATFAVIIGLLLWCRAVSIVILVASAWIALTAVDRDQPLLPPDQLAAHRAALAADVVTAGARLRAARAASADAAWWHRRAAKREVLAAQDALEDAVAEAAAAGALPRAVDVGGAG